MVALNQWKHLARVVQRLDNAIQRIAWFVLLTFIHLIVIYPVDSVVRVVKLLSTVPAELCQPNVPLRLKFALLAVFVALLLSQP